MPDLPCSDKTLNSITSRVSLISNSTLDPLFNDTTHISLRLIYRSVKISEQKKPFE